MARSMRQTKIHEPLDHHELPPHLHDPFLGQWPQTRQPAHSMMSPLHTLNSSSLMLNSSNSNHVSYTIHSSNNSNSPLTSLRITTQVGPLSPLLNHNIKRKAFIQAVFSQEGCIMIRSGRIRSWLLIRMDLVLGLMSSRRRRVCRGLFQQRDLLLMDLVRPSRIHAHPVRISSSNSNYSSSSSNHHLSYSHNSFSRNSSES